MTTVRRSRRRNSLAAATTLLVIAAASVQAHRRDEYLQATRIAIDPDRVHVFLDLTPGIAIADRIVPDVDRDGSGAISDEERRAYARRLLRAVHVDVDGTPVELALLDSSAPSLDAMRSGEGAIRVTAAGPLPRLSTGSHRLRYTNGFQNGIGVYLANALVPATDRVAITAQQRDVDQRELTIDYTLESGTAHSFTRTVALGAAGVILGSAVILRRRRRIVTPL